MALSVGDLVEGRVVHIQDAACLARRSRHVLRSTVLHCFARLPRAQIAFYEVTRAFQTSCEEAIWLELPQQSAPVRLHGLVEDLRLGDELADLVVESLHEGSGRLTAAFRPRARRGALRRGGRRSPLQPRRAACAALQGVKGRGAAGHLEPMVRGGHGGDAARLHPVRRPAARLVARKAFGGEGKGAGAGSKDGALDFRACFANVFSVFPWFFHVFPIDSQVPIVLNAFQWA